MNNNRLRRHKRVRAKISGTAKVPRLCVFRSSKHIYAQLIDDEKRKTIVSASDLDIKKVKSPKLKVKSPASAKASAGKQKTLAGRIAIAYKVGKILAEKALPKKITKVVFDRGGYKYHGRIKALADGAREKGLKF